jgi:Queuosine salvage protein
MDTSPSTANYWSRPVLRSVIPVVEASRHVRTSPEGIWSVAAWMAYEEFGFPGGGVVDGLALGTDPDHLMDLTLFETTLNFAFTDFDSGIKFEVVRNGRVYSDTEAMVVCIQEAINRGVPILDGAYLATVMRSDLETIFTGNIEMPMLDERVEILNEVGAVLVERYDGRFHRFVKDCAPAMYSDGDGILERLVAEFPRFNDVSDYHGHAVEVYKLAQLGLWMLHRVLHTSGVWSLLDLNDMTAFADYIVPVGLNVLGILEYADDLEGRIEAGEMIERDSDEEIEIRAHTLYATALLTDAVNAIRPSDKQLLIPEIDYRLWKTYHATFKPHHLTRTVMY